ncbi:hypothetical protein ATCC90586_007031 [Pythium insidiosum]|nr:hypothetical protein ATCC90586_007031 [Pythium insidiosum]
MKITQWLVLAAATLSVVAASGRIERENPGRSIDEVIEETRARLRGGNIMMEAERHHHRGVAAMEANRNHRNRGHRQGLPAMEANRRPGGQLNRGAAMEANRRPGGVNRGPAMEANRRPGGVHRGPAMEANRRPGGVHRGPAMEANRRPGGVHRGPAM